MEALYAFGLNAEECHELESIFKKVPEVSKVILYGSRARGDFRENSDIDLSLVGDSLTEQHLLKIKHLLYESCLPYFTDVHLYSDISNDDFRSNIQRDGKIIYRRTGEQ